MDTKQNNWGIPIAIVLAGILIAVAVIFRGSFVEEKKNTNTAPTNVAGEIKIRPVSTDDHIIGNPNASVVIVEYSDTECPFCKSFHSTMRRIMDTYGKTGDVAWVYRHFPIKELHSKAPKEAEATECANELGGPAKFWEFTNKLYDTTTSNNSLDSAMLPKLAQAIGLDQGKFHTCLSSGKYADKIEKDRLDGISGGVLGTPHSILISKDGIKTPISSAQSYDTVKQMIDIVLTKNPK